MTFQNETSAPYIFYDVTISHTLEDEQTHDENVKITAKFQAEL